MNIPITRPALGEEEARAPYESIKSGWVTQGPKVAEFERALASYVGARHGIATTSCTTGLHLALASIGVGPGDEVIVPSFTFIASANAVRYTGADVVFCEIDAVNDIAERHGIVVVEDAAPAIGESYRGRKVGSNAQQTVFSFHPRKVITTGEGGMITTDDDLLADRARKLRAHGMSVSDLERHRSDDVIIEEYNELGFNYRMTDIQASIGLVQLRRLDELLRVRRAKAKRYNEELSAIRGIGVPYVPPYAEHTYQSYCLRLTKDCRPGREELMTKLLRRGIATRRGVMASHLEKTYTSRYGTVSLPVTEEATRTTMLIPLYASMTDDEQTYVIDALREELGAA